MPSYGSNSFSNRSSVTRFLAMLFLSIAFWGSTHAEVVDFTLADANGVEHKLSDYRGKWLVINFWATWCAACL